MKKYQAVAFLLSTAMTVSSVAPVFGASNDIFGHWAEFTITKWQNEGRIGGYEDGTFKPDRAITRAEFVRLLNSAAPTAFTSSASINFSDVSESDWFYADVAKAVGGRVASGFEDGTFRPGETVTRMQAAVFICNAKGLTPNEAAANNFTDAAQIPSWAKGAVGAAVAAGYLSGYPDGSFGGSKGMTRAEAVSTLDRVLGGGSTTTTPSGEIDTTNRDNNNSTEDNRTAEAGNMVWTSGGSGGGSKKSSSSSSSSSSDKKTNNVTIRSQKDANEYEGKTLTGTTTIYPDNGLELKDIRFKGDVDIKVQSDAVVASAYADSDVAVAAAYAAKINIYFEGKTSVSGTITVVENNVPSSQVVITTRTPRALNASVVAKVATAILGFTIDRVEATAPVEVAEGASVGTVELGDDASLEVADTAKSVDKVDVTGDAKDVVLNGEGSTDVAVRSGASVENVEVNDNVDASVVLSGSATVDNVKVSDSASADVAVKDSANVGKVELSDTATAKVDVAADAKVDTITSTSTAKGSEVTGEGTVNKIEATDKSTIDTSNSGDNIPDVSDKPVTPTPTPTPTPDPGPGEEETAKITPETKEITASTEAQTVEFTATGFAADAEITWSVNAGGTGATIAANETDSTKATLTIPADATAGTVTVTAKAGDVTATATVTVKAADEEPGDVPVTSVTVSPETASISAGGEDLAFTATVAPDDATDKTVTWSATAVDADNQEVTGDTNFIIDPDKGILTVPAGSTAKTITVTATGTAGTPGTATVNVAAAVKEGELDAVLAAITDDLAVTGIAAADKGNQDVIEAAISAKAQEKINAITDTNVDKADWTATFSCTSFAPLTAGQPNTVAGKVIVQKGTEETTAANEKTLSNTSVTVLDVAPVGAIGDLGIKAPATGDTIPTTITVPSADTGKYTGIITWTKGAAGTDEVTETEFAAETVYKATITLTAKAGYKFVQSGTTATVGGKVATVAVADDSTDDTEGNKVTLTVTFEATDVAPAEITLAVKSASSGDFSIANTVISGADASTGIVATKTVSDIIGALEVKVDGAADADSAYEVKVYASNAADAAEVTPNTTALTSTMVVKVIKKSDSSVAATYTLKVAGEEDPEVTLAVASGNNDFSIANTVISGADASTGIVATKTVSDIIGALEVKVDGAADADSAYEVKVYASNAADAAEVTPDTTALTSTMVVKVIKKSDSSVAATYTLKVAGEEDPEVTLAVASGNNDFSIANTVISGADASTGIVATKTVSDIIGALEVKVDGAADADSAYEVKVYASNAADATEVTPDTTALTSTMVVKVIKKSDSSVAATYTLNVAGDEETEEVTALSITGLSTALAVDGTIPTIEVATADTDKYGVAATWTADGSSASTGDTIAAGEYVLTLVFTPKQGYTFPVAGIQPSSVNTDGNGLSVIAANDAAEGTLKYTITITVAAAN